MKIEAEEQNNFWLSLSLSFSVSLFILEILSSPSFSSEEAVLLFISVLLLYVSLLLVFGLYAKQAYVEQDGNMHTGNTVKVIIRSRR